MQIVDAAPEHLAGIARINDAVVVSSAATFDLEPPPAEHSQRMLASVDPSAGHFLIVALDDAGEVFELSPARLAVGG